MLFYKMAASLCVLLLMVNTVLCQPRRSGFLGFFRLGSGSSTRGGFSLCSRGRVELKAGCSVWGKDARLRYWTRRRVRGGLSSFSPGISTCQVGLTCSGSAEEAAAPPTWTL